MINKQKYSTQTNQQKNILQNNQTLQNKYVILRNVEGKAIKIENINLYSSQQLIQKVRQIVEKRFKIQYINQFLILAGKQLTQHNLSSMLHQQKNNSIIVNIINKLHLIKETIMISLIKLTSKNQIKQKQRFQVNSSQKIGDFLNYLFANNPDKQKLFFVYLGCMINLRNTFRQGNICQNGQIYCIHKDHNLKSNNRRAEDYQQKPVKQPFYLNNAKNAQYQNITSTRTPTSYEQNLQDPINRAKNEQIDILSNEQKQDFYRSMKKDNKKEERNIEHRLNNKAKLKQSLSMNYNRIEQNAFSQSNTSKSKNSGNGNNNNIKSLDNKNLSQIQKNFKLQSSEEYIGFSEQKSQIDYSKIIVIDYNHFSINYKALNYEQFIKKQTKTQNTVNNFLQFCLGNKNEIQSIDIDESFIVNEKQQNCNKLQSDHFFMAEKIIDYEKQLVQEMKLIKKETMIYEAQEDSYKIRQFVYEPFFSQNTISPIINGQFCSINNNNTFYDRNINKKFLDQKIQGQDCLKQETIFANSFADSSFQQQSEQQVSIAIWRMNASNFNDSSFDQHYYNPSEKSMIKKKNQQIELNKNKQAQSPQQDSNNEQTSLLIQQTKQISQIKSKVAKRKSLNNNIPIENQIYSQEILRSSKRKYSIQNENQIFSRFR